MNAIVGLVRVRSPAAGREGLAKVPLSGRRKKMGWWSSDVGLSDRSDGSKLGSAMVACEHGVVLAISSQEHTPLRNAE